MEVSWRHRLDVTGGYGLRAFASFLKEVSDVWGSFVNVVNLLGKG